VHIPPQSQSSSWLTHCRLKVLSLLSLDEIVTNSAPFLAELRDQKSTGEDLGISHLPALWKEKYGQPGCGVKRTTLNLALKNALELEKIEIREGWKLKEIIEREDGVAAISLDGNMVEGSFLIGCDGIKSVSRSLILDQYGLSQGEASYTGLTQVSCIS
jgi:salicylate hydroxylase